MAPIDLKEFALREQKLPRKFLSPTTQKPTPTWKILGAYFLDFFVVSTFTSFMAVMFNHSFKLLLTTPKLAHFFDEQSTIALASTLIPMMLFSYFFFSYYFNQGQTWGLHVFKTRMKMPSLDAKSSFYWAAHSLFLCLTAGLFYMAKKEEWQNIQKHDYLYSELLTHKEHFGIDLFKRIETEEVEEEFAEAA